ncbi:MAG: hypothetical protein L0229_31370 [Blastocatellia bacterium]|nr:hypothetical protein [Blastocatellia bacterium]
MMPRDVLPAVLWQREDMAVGMTNMSLFEKKRNPQLDPEFPVTVFRLREIYSMVSFQFEFHRFSFKDLFSELLAKGTLSNLAPSLTDPKASPPQPVPDLLQRHFYWSTACFYRAFYLMLAYFDLERKPFSSWAHVTAYYSRFYIIKAILNLFLINIINDKSLIYMGMNGVRVVEPIERLKKQWGVRGSHQIWWALFEQMGYVSDLAQIDGADFILSDSYFNSGSRNSINYSEQYMEGFKELEWFDISEDQMLSHLAMWRPRQDRDITDIDAFFEGFNPEDCDEGDFYGDEAQIIWLSIRVYLELLKAIGVQQPFVTKEKLFALLQRFTQDEYPTLCAGIRKSIADSLP